jgi:diaminopimelate epimerase
VNFTKLQATGNDFVLMDAAGLEDDWPRLARAMCHRSFGIGADGLLLLLKSAVADFRMRMFNPDGSEAEVCGNGLRCLARYVIDRGLADADRELTIETTAGIRRVKSCGGNWFQIDMGVPRFRPEEIPVSIEVDIIPILDYPINVGGKELLLNFVSLGNPHGVCFVEDSVADFPLSELGPLVEHHELFPQRLNFEVASVLSRREIRARVWERGAGETLSCGSGVCAVAVAAQLHGYVDSQVDVILPGGTLSVEWDGRGEVYLSGGAEMVFTGEWIR